MFAFLTLQIDCVSLPGQFLVHCRGNIFLDIIDFHIEVTIQKRCQKAHTRPLYGSIVETELDKYSTTYS